MKISKFRGWRMNLKGSNRLDAVVWSNLIEPKQRRMAFVDLIKLLLEKGEFALIVRRCNDSNMSRQYDRLGPGRRSRQICIQTDSMGVSQSQHTSIC